MKTETGRVIEALLRGQFICRLTDEPAWELLNDDDKRQQINDHLTVTNRTIASAADNTVYFCAYQDIGDDERKVITSQFNEMIASLQPLVAWMVLVQEAANGDEALAEGAIIRLNELQSTIEDVPALAEELGRIARNRQFNSTASAVDAQLKQVFKRLCELGYLLRPNAEKQIYLVTGKIEYLYDILKLIDETESLNLEQKTQQQESLL